MESTITSKKKKDLSILIINKSDNTAGINSILEKKGFIVNEIPAPREMAVEKVKEIQPDLVLLNINIEDSPHEPETAEIIKKDFEIPVILFSENSFDTDFSQDDFLNNFRFIQKPFDEAKLTIAIETTMYKNKIDSANRIKDEWLSKIFNTINDAFITSDSEGLITFMNKTAEGLTGWNIQDAIGKPLSDIFRVSLEKENADEDVSADYVKMKEVAKFSDDLFLISKNGHVTPIEKIGAQISDLNGKIDGSLMIFNDITDKKWAENMLSKLFKVVEQNPISIMITDKNGRIEYVNPKFTSLTGYSLKDILGSNPNILKSDNHEPGFYKNLWDTILSGNEWKGIIHNKKMNGEPYIESSSISPLRNQGGEIINFVSMKEDITEKKKIEDALRLTQFSVDTAGDGIIWIAENGGFAYVNNSMCKLLDYSHEELLKLNHLDINKSYKHEDWIKIWNDVKKKKSETFETCHTAKDGTIIDVQVTANYMKFNNHEYICAFVRDISERKKAKIQLDWLNYELEKTNKDLEQILYITSHDLRSPMVNVEGWSKRLEAECKNIFSILAGEDIPLSVKEKIAFSIDGKISQAVNFIESGISKMSYLLNALLQLSRTGRLELKIRNLDMNKLLAKVISTFEYQINQADIEVTVEDLPPCLGDESQINQVFSNLIDNALKYNDPGKNSYIKISGQEKFGDSLYCIEDNGIGIRKDCQLTIFKIFEQLNPESSGEGLGLAIVNKIIERHKGRVWIESAEKIGSKFFIHLPYTKNKKDSVEGGKK